MIRGACFAAVAAVPILAGCGGPGASASRPVAVTVVPLATAGGLPEPRIRYPEASSLERFDLKRPGEPSQALSAGMAAAGGASVSVDGRTLAFVGRQPGERFGVWTSDPEGRERQRLSGAPEGAGSVAWLPDGRLVIAAPVDGPPPLAGMSAAWALHVLAPGEAAARRITFGASELDPAVLADGRIVYSQWQPGGDGRLEGGSFSLFTVHPDGTGAAPLHGYHGGARLKLLPRQSGAGDLFFVAGDAVGNLALRGMDWRDPAGPSRALELPGARAAASEPAAAGELLVAGQEPSGASTLWLLDPANGEQVPALAARNGASFVHAVEIAPRARPQGHLSMVDPERSEGLLLCIDARPPHLPHARQVRLSAAAADGKGRQLGEMPLADDGSFFAVVPADLPLVLDLLDADGRVLMTTETPIWVRPKEVRACVGCHESALTAPPNRRPLAVLAEPVDLAGARDG